MAGAAHGDFHVSHTGVELSKTFAEIAASRGAVEQTVQHCPHSLAPLVCSYLYSGATGLHKTISRLEQDGIHDILSCGTLP